MNETHSIVIGGTRGLGRSLTRVLLERGDQVSIVARTAAGDRSFTADICEPSQLQRALVQIFGKHKQIDNLIFLQRYRGTGDTWEGEIATSLTATKNAIDKFLPYFRKGGSIVIVSSIAGELVADEQDLSYHVAKGGLNQMLRFLAVTLGADGIRVNGVSPGIFLQENQKKSSAMQRSREPLWKATTPLGRVGNAEEIARVIAFLCSNDASYITGQNIIVDGGLSLRWQGSVAVQLHPRTKK